MVTDQERQSIGVEGLDAVLGGGLLPNSSVLVCGAAGTGKTTLGLQFLCEGARLGEGGVYITFEEFPEQLYRDAAAFGWDLPALERAGKLQVIAVAPEVFMEQASLPGGLLEQLQAEVGMRRMVIDSLTLIEASLADQSHGRRSFYQLRNALRRLEVTTLLIEERDPGERQHAMSEYVADSLLYMTFDNLEGHRLRHIEVRKHRGSAFQSGQHLFVFAKNGIRVLPALNHIPDLAHREAVSTGLEPLDHHLSGGIPRGSAFVLNVNSKCNYRYLLGSIVSAHLREGGAFFSGRSTVNPPFEIARLLGLYGFDVAQLGAEGRWCGVEFLDRPAPEELVPYIIRVEDDPQGHRGLAQIVKLQRQGVFDTDRHWICLIDLNTLLRSVGEAAMVTEWTETVARARHHGHTILAICNFEEMPSQLASLIQRKASGILRTWFDGRYQYLQVQKAPNGRVSEPMAVEYTESPPYLALW